MASQYKIVFSGQIAPDKDINDVKKDLAALYKVSIAKIESWFSGRTIIVQKNCDYQKAKQIKQALEATGVICSIEPEGETNNAPLKTKINTDSKKQRQMMVCPKCGFEQPAQRACSRCKVIIGRYIEQKKKKEEAEQKEAEAKIQEEAKKQKNNSQPKKGNEGESKKLGAKKKQKILIPTIAVLVVLVISFLTYSFVVAPYLEKQALKKAEEARRQADEFDKEKCQKTYIALKKIEASLESGVRYDDYSNLVSSARLELNLLEGSSERGEQLTEIYNCYQLSKALWSGKIKDNGSEITEVIVIVAKKYKDYKPGFVDDPDSYNPFDYYEEAQQFLWEKATELLGQYEQYSVL